jgi:hypothetical protein
LGKIEEIFAGHCEYTIFTGYSEGGTDGKNYPQHEYDVRRFLQSGLDGSIASGLPGLTERMLEIFIVLWLDFIAWRLPTFASSPSLMLS